MTPRRTTALLLCLAAAFFALGATARADVQAAPDIPAAWRAALPAAIGAWPAPACGTVTLGTMPLPAGIAAVAHPWRCGISLNATLIAAWWWTYTDRCRILSHELGHLHGHDDYFADQPDTHDEKGTIMDYATVYTMPYPVCAPRRNVRKHARGMRMLRYRL